MRLLLSQRRQRNRLSKVATTETPGRAHTSLQIQFPAIATQGHPRGPGRTAPRRASQELDGEWALKRLLRKDRVARFQREVEILRRLEQDNIIKLVDAQITQDGGDEASFLVMPIAAHGNLDDRLAIYEGNIDSVMQVDCIAVWLG
jgi:serine/threonine protein kinase